jgi:hypothetical protein
MVHRACDYAHHAVPAMHGDMVHYMLVDELVPIAHACRRGGIAGTQRNAGKDVFEIFVDYRGVGDDDAVVVEHGDLAFGIDGQKPRRVLFEPVQIDVDALKIEPLLQQRNQGLQRVRRRLGVVILERHGRSLRDESHCTKLLPSAAN